MTETIDLNSIKIKIHRTILEDGLIEIMLGVYLTLSGIYLSNRSLILNYIWLPIGFVLIDILRRRYVYPRTGYAKISFSAAEIVRIFGALIIGIAVLTALIALIATGMGRPIEENWREIITFALIFFTVIFFCFIAHRFNVPRWYLHGITMGIVFPLSKMFDVHGLVLGLGVWIALVGVYVFLRFLNETPTGSEIRESSNAS